MVGYFLLMAWGVNGQMGNRGTLLDVCGVVGFVLLLPSMLLGYVMEFVGAGFGMAAETALMLIAQFSGYFVLVCGISLFPKQFSLKTLFMAITAIAA